MRVSVFVVSLVLLPHPTSAATPRLSDVSIEEQSSETIVRLTIEDGLARPSVHMLGDHRLILDLPGIEPSLRSHVVEAGTARLERVRIGIHTAPELRTRVVFDLTSPTAYAVTFLPVGLQVTLRSPGAGLPANAPPPEAGLPSPLDATTSAKPDPTPTVTVSPSPDTTPSPEPSPTPTATASPSPVPTPSPKPSPTPTDTASPSPVPTPSPEQPEVVESTDLEANRSTETPDPIPSGTVTIDFRDADVRTVIDLVANVGGYDVIFTPEVRGRITIRIIDDPWEEALDTVLAKKRLRATRHADLILVSPDDWE